MDLNRVAVFVRVVEVGSFTKAGAELGVPKSSVSRTVASLEASLGVQLLQRTTRKLSLTEAGREYFEQTRRLLADLNEATLAVSKQGKDPRGTVRMSAPFDLGALMLADTIARFTARYPRIHVDLSLTARRVDLVAEGFDLALRAAARLNDSSLIATKVASTDFGLFASRAYLERRGTPRTVEDLKQHCCVLFRGHNGSATWHLTGPKGEEHVAVKGPLNVDEMLFVVQSVERGVGIGLLPTVEFVNNLPERQQLVRVLPEYRAPAGALFVVLPAARHRPTRVTLLSEFLIQNLRALPWPQ